jgi:hypothetical protein
MSNANAVDYDCLDYAVEATHGAATAFPMLRRTTQGQIFNCPVVDGNDDTIQFAVGQYNDALNPFGIQYGHITYLGVSPATANMLVGWTPWAVCYSQGGNGQLVVQQRVGDLAESQERLIEHELAHAYLGAPDYYNNPSCFSGNTTAALVASPTGSAAFSPAGKDAVRYWALMDTRTRGASALAVSAR